MTRVQEMMAEVADVIRPALNEYPDGTLRVSKGQEDVAVVVTRLVVRAIEQCGGRVFGPPDPERFSE